MEKLKINAEAREVGKKGVNRRLRKGGLIPAVLYGRGQEARALSLPAKEFATKVKEAGLNALIDLEIAGDKGKGPLVVMLKEFQIDSLTRVITHVDLLKIDLREKVSVKIPVVVTGKAVGLTKGGLVEQSRRELEVNCLPGNIPESIEVDITALDIGDSLHIRDVKLPEGVEVQSDVDFAIVSIVAPKEEEAAPAAEAVPVEGAPAAAPGGTAATGAPADKEAKTDKDTKGEKGEKK